MTEAQPPRRIGRSKLRVSQLSTGAANKSIRWLAVLARKIGDTHGSYKGRTDRLPQARGTHPGSPGFESRSCEARLSPRAEAAQHPGTAAVYGHHGPYPDCFDHGGHVQPPCLERDLEPRGSNRENHEFRAGRRCDQKAV